jgi:hypothetical protein
LQNAKDEIQKLKLQKNQSKIELKDIEVTMDEEKSIILFSTLDKLEQAK